jgi:hypothetical protein
VGHHAHPLGSAAAGGRTSLNGRAYRRMPGCRSGVRSYAC